MTYNRWVPSPLAVTGPRRYHSMSTRPAASTTPTTKAGSCSTKSRSTAWPNHSSRWRTSAPACMPRTSHPPGASGRTRAATASGNSEAARWMSEYHPRTAAHAARAVEPPQVADLETATWEASAGLGHHRRRDVDPRCVGAAVGQVRSDVSWARADLHHRLSGRVGEYPVQQPGLGTADLAARRGGGRRRQLRRRRRTTEPVSRLSAPSAITASRSTVAASQGAFAGLVEEMNPASILLPGSPFEFAHQRLRTRRHLVQTRPRPRRGRRTHTTVRCACAAHQGLRTP